MGYRGFDIDELIDTAEFIEGLPFVRLEHVIRYKEIARRPKDLHHLKILDAAKPVDGTPRGEPTTERTGVARWLFPTG